MWVHFIHERRIAIRKNFPFHGKNIHCSVVSSLGRPKIGEKAGEYALARVGHLRSPEFCVRYSLLIAAFRESFRFQILAVIAYVAFFYYEGMQERQAIEPVLVRVLSKFVFCRSVSKQCTIHPLGNNALNFGRNVIWNLGGRLKQFLHVLTMAACCSAIPNSRTKALENMLTTDSVVLHVFLCMVAQDEH